MSRKRVQTGTRLPKALACGMLEDNGRVLFLFRRDDNGAEWLEMPCVLVLSGRSPFADIKEAFPRLTGIDGEVHEIVLEGRYNAGSRKRRAMVPCLVFKVTAKSMRAKPSPEFSGFRWLSLEDAKEQRLAKTAAWLRSGKPV
jgi:hypothetical protein